jgi:hypothetical protein
MHITGYPVQHRMVLQHPYWIPRRLAFIPRLPREFNPPLVKVTRWPSQICQSLCRQKRGNMTRQTRQISPVPRWGLPGKVFHDSPAGFPVYILPVRGIIARQTGKHHQSGW